MRMGNFCFGPLFWPDPNGELTPSLLRFGLLIGIEFQIVGLERLDIGITPKRFNVVIGSGFWLENVHQHIEIVQQNPFTVLQALHMYRLHAGHTLCLFLNVIA